ncbi:MAG: glucokinase [Candidatus Eiseniibacteriota bacterium]
MILAGDIGGTNASLALFERNGAGRLGRPLHAESFRGADFPSLAALLEAYRAKHTVALDAACFDVAGPVIKDTVRGTNIPWVVSAADTAKALGIRSVFLLNDLAAAGYAVPILADEDLVTIQRGVPDSSANAAVISAGTGLGETILARVGGELIPIASEGGFGDFAPRTDDEIELLRDLRGRLGRVAYEHVLSGPGLSNVARFTHARGGAAAGTAWSAHQSEAAGDALAARISAAGQSGACRWCGEALDLFVSVYGAEAGNLALRGLARAGVYLGGGIAPKILPALQGPQFLQAFREKAPHEDLLAAVPIHVIRNERAGVLGAARYASLSLTKGL